MNNQTAPRGLVIAAFAAIYLIWGSTYLGISFAVQTIPPHVMAAVRFLVSGAILFAFLRWRGVPTPKLIHWRSALVVGILLLGLGNGSVSWAETMIPSGLASLMIAIVPLWMVLMDWLRPGGTRPQGKVFLGIALGFAGMVLLIGPAALGLDRPLNYTGVAITLLASLAWSFGSIYSRHADIPDNPLLLTAMEMLTGGVFLVAMAFVLGEFNGFTFAHVSSFSWTALAYLIVIGSLVAFSAYVFLLQASTPAKISTYAYVNPVVAVFLGWALNGEQITLPTLAASAIIIAGVAIITFFNTRPQPKPSPVPDQEPEPRLQIAMD
ncbi:MAG: EamA family transporter [Chloroflexi bacterium]|nr:EamA family transporter [Chloroflexota bacterium]